MLQKKRTMLLIKHQYSALCAPTLSQYAAVEACKNTFEDVETMKQSYKQRAQFFTKSMNDIGLDTIMPSGGLYCFTSVKKQTDDALTFAEELLKKQRVAVVPGNVFGSGGDGYFRACVATNFDDLKEATKRFRRL